MSSEPFKKSVERESSESSRTGAWANGGRRTRTSGFKPWWRSENEATEPAALAALRKKGLEIDVVTQVDAWMEEWGSAVEAVKAALGSGFRGPKPEWLTALEEAAEDERRRDAEETADGTTAANHPSDDRQLAHDQGLEFVVPKFLKVRR
ncbi:hypothetical protein OIU34_24385 [Pararhizobium sp. BT-229]|uniref:hypothetical protein n=1 Tax=Pararhizobium sp. BT-229 TaxID=2986923 RepID=UPI0021F7B4CF|nr:hypothetical protein [Pararhizobium sp. BT-229]MCV9965039.1 hypothetical protein [Pararhizobium sp. BT-229]